MCVGVCMCVCMRTRSLSGNCAFLLYLLSLLRERARRVLLHEIEFVGHLVLVLVFAIHGGRHCRTTLYPEEDFLLFAIHGGRHRRTTLYPIAGHTNSDVAASKACQHRVKHVSS